MVEVRGESLSDGMREPPFWTAPVGVSHRIPRLFERCTAGSSPGVQFRWIHLRSGDHRAIRRFEFPDRGGAGTHQIFSTGVVSVVCAELDLRNFDFMAAIPLRSPQARNHASEEV